MKKVIKEMEKTPKIALLTFFLLLTMLISLVEAIIRKNWVFMISIIIIAILVCLPKFIEKWSNIAIPNTLETYIIIFFYISLFLGELYNYYTTYWWWDVLIHISSGVAFGIIGFIILYVLYKTEKIKTSPKMIAIFSFVFAIAIGALWEIAEFTIDQSFGTNMQSGSFYWIKTPSCGLADTMKDLIDDSIGALFSAVMGYLYLRRESEIIVKPIVKEFKKDNPKLFKKRNNKKK